MKKGKWGRITVLMIVFLFMLSNVSVFANNQTSKFNMSYLYFGSPDNYINLVNRTNNSLNMVSPNYFDVDRNGNLVWTGTYRKAFVDEMHNRGIKVVPFLANHWDITAGQNAFENRHALSTAIAQAIEHYNLDGINVDIEGVGHAYRDQHTDFIRLLREKIPAHKEVSVAVAANPNGWNVGWHGNYDYRTLAQYADYLMIMAYDEHWQGSTPGPVASLSFVERSIQYALNQGVPKEKIVVGMSFYGRIWKTDGERNADGFLINGRGVSHNQIQPVLDRYNGQVVIDEHSQTPKATFTVREGDTYMTVGGVRLTPGEYVIWFDNEHSIKKKLQLVNSYDIKGTGSWSLFQEDPQMWSYYKTYLNGLPVIGEPVEEPIDPIIPIEPSDPVDAEPQPNPEPIEEPVEEITPTEPNAPKGKGNGNGKGNNRNVVDESSGEEEIITEPAPTPTPKNNGNGNGNGRNK